MENTNKDIKAQMGGQGLIILGNTYKVNAHTHYLYTQTLCAKLVKLFEILWDEKCIKQYIINITIMQHAWVFYVTLPEKSSNGLIFYATYTSLH